MVRHLLVCISLLLVMVLVVPIASFSLSPDGRIITCSTSAPRIHTVPRPVVKPLSDRTRNQKIRSIVTRSAANTPSSDDYKPKRRTLRQRFRSVRKYVRRTMASILLAASFFNYRATDALAAPPEKIMSIRPGMDHSQAQAMSQGNKAVLEEFEEKAASLQKQKKETTAPKAAKVAPKKKQMDDYDDDDEDAEFLLQDEMAATKTDQSLSDKLSNNRRENFATYKTETNKKALTLKVAVAFFVPSYGILIVREYVRRRREERYVEKGLEILEAQKAEYFNITATTNDSDLSDAIKKLNSTDIDDDDDDEDDDDDDDEDDDDEDEPEPTTRRPRPPRKPLGGGPSGASGGGDSGDGRPSDEDLDKLNKIFGKS